MNIVESIGKDIVLIKPYNIDIEKAHVLLMFLIQYGDFGCDWTIPTAKFIERKWEYQLEGDMIRSFYDDAKKLLEITGMDGYRRKYLY